MADIPETVADDELIYRRVFADYYKALEIYRADILIPFGVASMLIQGAAWSYIYSRLFAGEPVIKGAIKFATLATPLAWSYLVLVIGAKHRMTSVFDFVVIETAFTILHYVIVSPFIALVYARKS